MAEKIIILDDVSLLEIFGSENSNLKRVALAFPKTKIVSRGNELTLIGTDNDIVRVTAIIDSLVLQYQKYGTVTKVKLDDSINQTPEPSPDEISDDVILFGDKGLVVKPRTDNQKKLVATHIKNDLVFAVGPAGTGKTYISVALAVKALKNKEVKKIIITRPAVEAGESLGFLPGDLSQKIDPYLRPLYDALYEMMGPDRVLKLIERNIIELAPLAYMRGRTLNDAFIILDEAQNTTTEQMKMFLTRLGFGSTAVITGDITQIDLPGGVKSGLKQAINILQEIPGMSFTFFESGDVVRHPLVQKIVEAYEKFNSTLPPQRGDK